MILTVEKGAARAVHVVSTAAATLATPACAHDLLQWWVPGRGVLPGRCSAPCSHGIVIATEDFGGMSGGVMILDLVPPDDARQPTDPA